MLPGLILIAVGAALAYGSPRLCRAKEKTNTVKLIGVLLAAAGAALVFLA